MSFPTVRRALQEEVDRVLKELKKLNGLMATLDGPSASSPSQFTGKKRGRKSAAEKQAASEASLGKAIDLIEAAGKGGVKAIRLSYMLKGEGHQLPGKVALLGSGRVKMTGKGGASTYVFTG